jgi:hypothetical protein
LDLSEILTKATAFPGCDVEDLKKTARVSASRVLDRDLLLYVVWQLEVQTDSQIGEIFGLTGSAVSRRVGVLKSKAENDKSIRKKMAEITSIIET